MKVVTHLVNMSSRLCTGLGAPQVKKRELYSQGSPTLEVEAHRSLWTIITYCSQSKDASKVDCSSVEVVRNYLSMGVKTNFWSSSFLRAMGIGQFYCRVHPFQLPIDMSVMNHPKLSRLKQ